MSNLTNLTANFIKEYVNGYPDWLVALLIITLSIVSAKIICFIIEKYISKLTSLTDMDVDDKIVAVIKIPLYYSIILIGFLIVFEYLRVPYYEYFSLATLIILVIINWLARVLKGWSSLILASASNNKNRMKEYADDVIWIVNLPWAWLF